MQPNRNGSRRRAKSTSDGERSDDDYHEGDESEEDDEEIPVSDPSPRSAGAKRAASAVNRDGAKRGKASSGAGAARAAQCSQEERTLYVSGFDKHANVDDTCAKLNELFTKMCGDVEAVELKRGGVWARVLFCAAAGLQEALKQKQKARRDSPFLMPDGLPLKVEADLPGSN